MIHGSQGVYYLFCFFSFCHLFFLHITSACQGTLWEAVCAEPCCQLQWVLTSNLII